MTEFLSTLPGGLVTGAVYALLAMGLVFTYKATRVLCRHKLAAEMPPELCDSLNAFLAKNVPGYVPPEGGEKPVPASPVNKKN